MISSRRNYSKQEKVLKLGAKTDAPGCYGFFDSDSQFASEWTGPAQHDKGSG